MPSIPIQNLMPRTASSITGGENVPVVQTMGSNFYTYQTPISNFFYRNAIPFSALSSCPLSWSTTNVSTGTGTVTIGSPNNALHTLIGQYPLNIYGSNATAICAPDPRIRTFGIGGSITTPTAVLDGGVLGSITGFGYNGTSFNGSGFGGVAGINIQSKGQQTTTSSGGFITLNTSLSGSVNQIQERMRIDHNGQVGIGTANPSTALDVRGTITLGQNNQQLRFTDTSGTFPNLSMQNDNNFVFYGTNSTGSSRAIYSIMQRSNTSTFNFNVPVGIGRSALSAAPYNSSTLVNLDVQGQIRATAAANEGGRLIIGNTLKTDLGVNNWAIWNMTGQYNNGLAFWKYHENGLNGDSTVFLSDSANGAVGIGPSFREPTAPLHVRADTGNPRFNGIYLENAKTTASDHAVVAISTNGSGSGDPIVSWDIKGVIGWSAGIDNSDSDKFKISNNWNDLTSRTRMVISETNLTTGAGGHTSFLINNFTEADVARPVGWGGGISTLDVYATGTVGAGPAGGAAIPGTTNTSPRAYLNSAGIVAGVSFNSTSSIRFKKNVEPLSDALSSLQKLRGVTYNWIETGKSDIGLIAEEVNEVFPEVVKKDETDVPEGIDYGKLVAVLIESVKELTEKVKILEGKVK